MSERDHIGEIVAKWVVKKSISKTALANFMGVTRPMIYTYLDDPELAKDKFLKMADFIGIPFSEYPEEYSTKHPSFSEVSEENEKYDRKEMGKFGSTLNITIPVLNENLANIPANFAERINHMLANGMI